jgi:hypothetical protein
MHTLTDKQLEAYEEGEERLVSLIAASLYRRLSEHLMSTGVPQVVGEE